MPALPYNGTCDAALFNSRSVTVAPALVSNSIRVEGEGLYFRDSGKDDSTGNPAPSYKLARYGKLTLRIAVSSGNRVVYVQVRQPDASASRPYMRVKANADIGLNTPLTSTAGSSTGWQTLAVSVPASQDGGVEVELVNTDLSKPCWFDNLAVL